MSRKLVIYKKDDKYYFSVVERLPRKQEFYNSKMEKVVLTSKNKVESYQFNGWEDFKKIRDYLRVNFGLKILVINVKAKDKTYQKLFMELMNNPLYNLMLAEREEENEVSEDEMANIQAYAIENRHDWLEAQKEFGFESDFVDNLFDKEMEN